MKTQRGFTMTELLIVISIIGILSALLLPVLSTAKTEGQKAACMNQLKQFDYGISSYMTEHRNKYPMWLSSMLRDYTQNEKLYICPLDQTKGTQGGRPDWLNVGMSQYAETNDINNFSALDEGTFAATDRITLTSRDTDIKANSYLFEFTGEICSWYNGGYGSLVGGVATWRECKDFEVDRHVQSPTGDPLGQKVPVIRCFWHIPETDNGMLTDPSGGGATNPQHREVMNLRNGHTVTKSWPTTWYK